ncbi:MOSC domain-containing protein [Streptomyces sp. NPDC052036]|uniref:MOSC domain-containing protein n=1 Tax=Streptomyces sp. NPDC052036 TaxID=3155171 RepID=UPI0034479B7D
MGDPELNAQLSKLLGRSPRLSADAPADAPLERATPEYEGGVPDTVRASSYVDETGEEITVDSIAPGTFFDNGRIHLVTTSSLAVLRAVRPDYDFDPRRFRPNLVIDTGEGQGFLEDTCVGCRVRVGEALCRVVVPTPRCVVPTLGHDELRPDLSLMRTISRTHRLPVFDLGRLACLGVYLDVLAPGLVRAGDPLTQQDGP